MVWVLVVGRTFCAALFAIAAFAPPCRLWRPGLALAASVVGGTAAVMLHYRGTQWVRRRLGLSSRAGIILGLAPGPYFAQHPAALALQLATAALYGTAAIGFFCRSRQFGDHFLGWLTISGVLAAFCHLNYALYSYPDWQIVHTGDIFRLCFYTTLLIGSMREIWSYWRALSEAAVLKERRRIACDLHDGLAQDLAFLSRNLAADREPGEEALRLLRSAVERAQLESRRVVSTLAAADGEPVEVALAKATAEVAKRFQLSLRLDLISGVKVSAAREEALVRIACEAVANAAATAAQAR